LTPGVEIVDRNGDALGASFDPATGGAGTPAELFRKPSSRLSNSNGEDVRSDGSCFLRSIPAERPNALANTVVLNWMRHLKRVAP
jgi:hypothetical protein